jgi:hypothetical protein
VNKLTTYTDAFNKDQKARIPGHVRAAINWNLLCEANSDNYSTKITDGMKVIVCKLRDNPMGFTSVAYPIDIDHVPTWFKELPFNELSMSSANITKKVDNLLGVLKWDLEGDTNIDNTFNSMFEFV